jgi:hypothetical protein
MSNMLKELELVERSAEAARLYASRWQVEPWHAYLWMLECMLTGKMQFMKVEGGIADGGLGTAVS